MTQNIEEKKVDYSSLLKKGVYQGSGKCKASVSVATAKVNSSKSVSIKVRRGDGQVIDYQDYFTSPVQYKIIEEAIALAGIKAGLEITLAPRRGGISSHAYASRIAIVYALVSIDSQFKALFNEHKITSKAVKKVLPKKAGLKKARKAPQFSKR